MNRLIPKMVNVIPYLEEACKKGVSRGLIVKTEAFPFCILGNCKEMAVELERDLKGSSNSRIKHKKCIKCSYFDQCEGVWRGYLDLFGWREMGAI